MASNAGWVVFAEVVTCDAGGGERSELIDMCSAGNRVCVRTPDFVWDRDHRPVTGCAALSGFVADEAIAAESGLYEVVENPAWRVRRAVDVHPLVALVTAALAMADFALGGGDRCFQPMIGGPCREIVFLGDGTFLLVAVTAVDNRQFQWLLALLGQSSVAVLAISRDFSVVFMCKPFEPGFSGGDRHRVVGVHMAGDAVVFDIMAIAADIVIRH